MYDTIVIKTTINCTYNANVPSKKWHKNADKNIENSVRNRADRWENWSNWQVSAKIYRLKLLGQLFLQ